MRYLPILVFSLFMFTTGLSSCQKSTCPTYATSGPTKNKKKKGVAAYDKGNGKRDKKTANGKPSTGLF